MKFNKITKLDEQIYRLHPISKKLAHLPKYKKSIVYAHKPPLREHMGMGFGYKK